MIIILIMMIIIFDVLSSRRFTEFTHSPHMQASPPDYNDHLNEDHDDYLDWEDYFNNFHEQSNILRDKN